MAQTAEAIGANAFRFFTRGGGVLRKGLCGVEMEMSKDRIGYVDLLKTFAIMLVLLGHSVQYIKSGVHHYDHPLWAFIYSFHMPLFMFISGMFFKSSLNKGFVAVVSAKFVRLVLPAISLTLFLAIASAFTSGRFSLAWANLGHLLLVKFWFVRSLFCCIVILHACNKMFRNEWVAMLLPLIFVLLAPKTTVFHLNFMFPCFCFGAIVCRIGAVSLLMFLASGAVFGILLGFWSGHYTVYAQPTRIIDYGNLTVDWRNLAISVYRLAIGCSGSLFFLCLARYLHRWVGEVSWMSKMVRKIGGETLGVYLFQTVFLEQVLSHLCLTFSPIVSCAMSFMAAGVGLVICLAVVGIVNRWAIARLLFLGRR